MLLTALAPPQRPLLPLVQLLLLVILGLLPPRLEAHGDALNASAAITLQSLSCACTVSDPLCKRVTSCSGIMPADLATNLPAITSIVLRDTTLAGVSLAQSAASRT